MTLSVRLDDDTKRLLTKLARSRRTSRSEVVRQAIRALAKEDPATEEFRPYDLVKDVLDKLPPSGLPTDTAARHKEYFTEYLNEKKRKGTL